MAMGAHHAGKGHLVRSRTDSRSADRVDCARRMQLPHPKPASAPFRPPISKVPALPLTSFSPTPRSHLTHSSHPSPDEGEAALGRGKRTPKSRLVYVNGQPVLKENM